MSTKVSPLAAAATDHLNDPVFRRVVDSHPNAVWLLQRDGQVAYANTRAQALFGAVPGVAVPGVAVPGGAVAGGAVAGASWCGQWPSGNQPNARRAFQAALKGQPDRFRTFVFTRPGTHIYLDTEISPVFEGDGTFRLLLAIAEDVTAGVEEVAFLRSVIQQLPLSLTAKDVDTGRYLLFNRAAEELYGVSAEDAVGRTAAEVFQSDMADEISVADDRALHCYEARLAVEEDFIDALTARVISTHRAVTFDDAGPRHLLTVGEDITERKASSEALRAALDAAHQASVAKSMFVANMSHEIRTPLNSVIAAAKMMADSNLDQRQRVLSGLIQAGGNTLHALLSDILDLARLEAGVVRSEPAPFQIADLVRDAATAFKLEAERRSLCLTLEISPAADLWVIGDGRHVRQIIDNLLGNGLKFTEQGSVSVALEMRGANTYRITVSDTGIGFEPARKEEIFQRFQQFDSTHSRRFGGAGLGLAICRELCDLMGAQIDCDSTPGRGSAFWLELSFPSADPLAQAAAPDIEAPAYLSILVAEDNAANRAVLGLMLDSVAEVCMVENGALAVEALRSRPFDLVLMDMQMPEMDGVAATSAIRDHERSNGQTRIPIIMLTANTHPDHVAASLAAGANLHLSKPITPSTLFRAMNLVLSD